MHKPWHGDVYGTMGLTNVNIDWTTRPDYTDGYDQRVNTPLGTIRPQLYGEQLRAMCDITQANMERLNAYQIQRSGERCRSRSNVDSTDVHRRESGRKWVCQGWGSSDVTDNDDPSTYVDRRCKYCYLCSTVSEKQSHPVDIKPVRQRIQPRFEFIAPPPTTWPRPQHIYKRDVIVHDILYKLAVTTGNKPDAGTDANAFIHIIGSDGTLPKTALCKGHGSVKFTFGRSTTETFFVKGPVLGNIKVLTLQHDGEMKNQGWYIENVQITNMSTGQQWVCQCRRWLSLHQSDYRIKVDLEAKILQPDLVDYSITVITGHKMFSGTDAQVYVTMYGKRGHTKKVHLRDKNKSCFEKGSKDTFHVALRDVGELRRLRVEHDGSGTAPGWFLHKIIVSTKDRRYFFPCDDWISESEGSRKLWRELLARGKLASRIKETNTRYEVTVCTGDVKFAGTDANVYIIMNGAQRHTDKLHLKNDRKNNFEKGKTDTFTVDGENIGDIKSLVIGHDNAGLGPGWFLREVSVRRYLTQQDIKDRRNIDTKSTKSRKTRSTEDNAEERVTDDYQSLSEFSEFRQLEKEILIEYEEGKKLMGRSRSNNGSDSEQSDDAGKWGIRNMKFVDGSYYDGHDGSRSVGAYGKQGLARPSERKESTVIGRPLLNKNDVGSLDESVTDRVVSGSGRDRSKEIPKFEQYVFICESWLAKDEGDGATERELLPQSKRVYYTGE